MIQITPQMRIFVAVEPIDFRNGIDGLSRLCREIFKSDPFSGWLFVFRNRRGSALKILAFDGQGFWLLQKRLSTGRFKWWPKDGSEGIQTLQAHELQLLIWNGNPSEAQVAPMWRKVSVSA